MKKQASFTILELLISLSISAFVILGMLQGYQNVTNFIERTRGIMVINRKVCLFFNQLERDLTTAFVPVLNKRIKPKAPEKVGAMQQPLKAEDEKKEDDYYFVGEVFPDNPEKIKGKRREPFKFVNFITTNALRIYAHKRVMLVRVMYELVKDKQNSKRGKDVYQLLRRETTELDNFKFKEDDSVIQKDKASDIKTVVVADNIKKLFVEYIADKPEQEKKAPSSARPELGRREKEVEKERLFVWGESKDTKDIVPEMVEVMITFWDDKLERENTFECLIPILSYPTQKQDDKKQAPPRPEKPGQVKPVVAKREPVKPVGTKV